jgi:capsular exopolysaccharide synthesis family protein
MDIAGTGPVQLDDYREWGVPGADDVFRGIYTRCGTGSSDVLAICSALTGEGKTTLGLGLATTIAQDFPDRRVLLVEADLKRPVLATDFDVASSPGLAESLLGTHALQLVYRDTFLENLNFVPAGKVPKGAGRLIASSRMAAAVDLMRQTHDIVILDTPALLSDTDALMLSDLADGIVFVVRSGVTSLTQMNKAIGQLDEDKIRGIVLNAAQSSIPGWMRRMLGL